MTYISISTSPNSYPTKNNLYVNEFQNANDLEFDQHEA